VDDLDDLAVTERIITETLRMFPPVYALPRRTDTAVAVDGYRIPGERWVIAPVVNIHRDERWYDDPETFRPARWRGDLRGEIPDFAYLPFGAGPRICIGREFALVEAKLALATIGRRYDCRWLGENTRHGEPPSSPEMTLRMEPGQEFLVTER
jgi:cytochrome P450